MTPRSIPQERSVRAVAAVHVLVGLAAIVGAVGWFVVEAARSHNPRDLGAIAIPIIAMTTVVCGAAFIGLACLLWRFQPVARWTTAALAVGAAWLGTYEFLHYDLERVTTEVRAWRAGAEAAVLFHLRGALIEILIGAWSAIVLLALFRPGSRRLFSADYRAAVRADRVTRIRFETSPFFISGVILGLVIACAMVGYS